MQDDRLGDLAEDRAVDAQVIVGAAGHTGERATGHQDDPAALALDERTLLLVRARDVIERDIGGQREVIGAGAACDHAIHGARFADRAADQLARCRPVEPHPALRGIHRLGHRQTVRP